MTNHPQRFRIVGFFDQHHKWKGSWQIVHFQPEDVLELPHVPSAKQLNEFVKLKGYKKVGWKYRPGEANPVYEIIGEGRDGFEYLNCPECHVGGCEAVDNVRVRR